MLHWKIEISTLFAFIISQFGQQIPNVFETHPTALDIRSAHLFYLSKIAREFVLYKMAGGKKKGW